MRILGIDPGLRRTGFGVIEVNQGKLHYIHSGVIEVESKLPLAQRLKTIFDGINQIAQETQPTVAAIEIVFVNTNPASTLLLGQARGAALCALAQHCLDIHEYTALQIKKSVVGAGHANKQQVQLMVQHLLKLNAVPGSDSADALAGAICHAHTHPLQSKLSAKHTLSPQGGKSRLRHGRLIR